MYVIRLAQATEATRVSSTNRPPPAIFALGKTTFGQGHVTFPISTQTSSSLLDSVCAAREARIRVLWRFSLGGEPEEFPSH